jgi:hypothetical protein
MAAYDPTAVEDQYNAYLQANNPDMAQGGDVWAGDKEGYQKFLQSEYRDKYGSGPNADLGKPWDWSSYQRANADTLSGEAGFTWKVGGGLLDPAVAYHQLYQAQKYDPNATLEQVGEGKNVQYVLHMDDSKLPKFQGGTADMSRYGGWAPIDPTGENSAELARDPRFIVHDPNYGDYTVRSNLKPNPSDQQDPLWRAIQMGAFGAAGIATGGLSGLVMGLPGAFGAAEQGNFSGILGAIMSGLGQMTGVPGAGSILNYIMQQLQQQRTGG